MEKMKKGHKIESKDSAAWAELSDDLVGEIISRLCFLSDQVRFRAVCKNYWVQAVDLCNNNNNNKVSLPWIIDIKTSVLDNIEYHLYEPSPYNCMKPTVVCKNKLQHSSVVDNTFKCGFGVDNTYKYGWIFTCAKGVHPLNFLLFSPLTKKEIILPELACFYNNRHRLLVKTFSTKPDSPDCVFLVLYRNLCEDSIIINVFGHGFKEWKSREFSVKISSCSSTLPVFIDGVFYFVFLPKWKLASYNVASAELKLESDFLEGDFSFYYSEVFMIYQAFELNGEFMFICVGKNSGFIKMFDRDRKVWVPLKSLGDHSVFITDNSILVPKVKLEGRSNYGISPNKIYCRSYWQCNHGVYSLDCGKLAKLSDDSDDITKFCKATNLLGHWFEPILDFVKKKDPGTLEGANGQNA